MNHSTKFKTFLESLKTDENKNLIENINLGYQACFEFVQMSGIAGYKKHDETQEEKNKAIEEMKEWSKMISGGNK